MQQLFAENNTFHYEKQCLSIKTYLSKNDFILLVSLSEKKPEEEKLFISIYGNNLTLNYEFYLEGLQSQSKIIALPDDLDTENIFSEFEERILRLIIPRTLTIHNKQNSMIVLSFPHDKNIQKDKIDLPKIGIEKPIEHISNPFASMDYPTNLVKIYSLNLLEKK